jgi:2-methylisocitrate lyase-like PEP mutase family enzyme
MDQSTQIAQAEAFRRRHRGPGLLLLPNAWDAASARIFVATGFEAIATTSGGVSWALGYADGEHAPWAEVVAATARVVRAAGVPVTADIEAGFADTPEALMQSIRDIIEAGAVGVNLEDGTPRATSPIRSAAAMAERIRAAREAAHAAGVPIVINGRTDLYLRHIGDEAGRFDDSVARAKAYLAAGADCFYPITLRDPATIERLAKAVAAPININIRAGSPSVAELERLGVARASTASQISLVAYGAAQQAAQSMRQSGGFEALDPSLTTPEMQKLFLG